MAILTKRAQPDRNKINMSLDHEVKYWAHELGITRAQLQQIVNKVGKFRHRSPKGIGKVKPNRGAPVGPLRLVDIALAICLSGLLVSVLRLVW